MVLVSGCKHDNPLSGGGRDRPQSQWARSAEKQNVLLILGCVACDTFVLGPNRRIGELAERCIFSPFWKFVGTRGSPHTRPDWGLGLTVPGRAGVCALLQCLKCLICA